MPLSSVEAFFKGDSLKRWQSNKEAEIKMLDGINERLNALIKATSHR